MGVKQRFSKSINSSAVEFSMAVAVQSRASCSGILVNSDFTSKDASL